MKIRMKTGDVLDLVAYRAFLTPQSSAVVTLPLVLLDALEAVLSVPKRSPERDDEKAVTAYNFAIADVRHAAGVIEE